MFQHNENPEYYWGGDGESQTLFHNGSPVSGYSFRTIKNVERCEELLAQGRGYENSQRKKRLNKLPYLPNCSEARTAMKNEYIKLKSNLNQKG